MNDDYNIHDNVLNFILCTYIDKYESILLLLVISTL